MNLEKARNYLFPTLGTTSPRFCYGYIGKSWVNCSQSLKIVLPNHHITNYTKKLPNPWNFTKNFTKQSLLLDLCQNCWNFTKSKKIYWIWSHWGISCRGIGQGYSQRNSQEHLDSMRFFSCSVVAIYPILLELWNFCWWNKPNLQDWSSFGIPSHMKRPW